MATEAEASTSTGMPAPTESNEDARRLFRVGDRVSNRYRILHFIARGGMGEVYAALDSELGQPVALKAVRPEVALHSQTLRRFRREINLSRKVTHQNVCRIYDVGTHFSAAQDLSIRYLTMELLEGATLTRYLRKHGTLSVDDALPLVVQIAAGLGAAHAAGVVHRDFKTSNVLLTETPRGLRAVITDFGLSQTLAEGGKTPADSDKLTGTGQLMGTLAYLAPEQLEGKASSAATDIYSLGVVLYQMVTGRLPFDGGSPLMAALKRLHEDPPDPRSFVPGLDEAWCGVLLCCLQRDPALRFQSTEELLEALGVEITTDSSTVISRPIPDRQRAAGTATDAVPAPSPAVGSSQVPLPNRALPMWKAVALALLVGLFVLALTQMVPWLISEPPIHVLVAEPSIFGENAPFIASSFEAAVLRGLASLQGVQTLDSSKMQGVGGPPSENLRTAAADELVQLQARDIGHEWQLNIKRFGRDGEVLWVEDFRVPQDDPRLQADAIQAAIGRAYPGRESTGSELDISSEDYAEFLLLRYAIDLGPRDMTWPEVLSRLQQLRRRAPEFPETLLYEARAAAYLYRLTRDPSYLNRAFKTLEQARAQAPGDPRPVENEINLAILVGDLDRAAQAVGELRKIAPGDIEVSMTEARLADARGDAALAVDKMSKACEIRFSARCRHNLASYLLSAGRIDEARAVLQQVIETWPTYSYGKSSLAELELRHGHLARARSLYEEVFDPAKVDHTVALNLAVVYLIDDEYQKAADVYRLVAAEFPGNPGVLIGLADAEKLLGNHAVADVLYTEILERVPEDSVMSWLDWSLRAQAQAHLGHYEAGAESVRRSLETGRTSGDAHLLAALVHVVIGEPDEARREVELARQLGIADHMFQLPWLREAATD